MIALERRRHDVPRDQRVIVFREERSPFSSRICAVAVKRAQRRDVRSATLAGNSVLPFLPPSSTNDTERFVGQPEANGAAFIFQIAVSCPKPRRIIFAT